MDEIDELLEYSRKKLIKQIIFYNDKFQDILIDIPHNRLDQLTYHQLNHILHDIRKAVEEDTQMKMYMLLLSNDDTMKNVIKIVAKLLEQMSIEQILNLH